MLLTIKKCFVSSQYLSEQTACPVVFMTTVYFSNNACKNALGCVFCVFFFSWNSIVAYRKNFCAWVWDRRDIFGFLLPPNEKLSQSLSRPASLLYTRARSLASSYFLISLRSSKSRRRHSIGGFPHISQLNHPWIHNCLSIFLLQNDRQEFFFFFQ